MRIRAAKKKTNFWNPGDACITNPKVKKFRTENLWSKDPITSVTTSNTNKIVTDDNNSLKSADSDMFPSKHDYVTRLMVYMKEKLTDPEVYLKANQIVENINKNFITDDLDNEKNKPKYFELLLTILNAPNSDELNQSAILYLLCNLLKSTIYSNFEGSFSSLYETIRNILKSNKYKRTLVHTYALKISVILLKSIKKEHCSRQNIFLLYSQIFEFIFHQNQVISKTAIKQLSRFIEKSGSEIISNLDVKIFNTALCHSSLIPFKMKPLMKLLQAYVKSSSFKNIQKICSNIFNIFLTASTNTRCLILDTFSAIFKSSCHIHPDLFKKIFSLLREIRPGVNDIQEFVVSWIKMSTNLYVAYFKSYSEANLEIFVECALTDIAYLYSGRAGVPALACESLIVVVRNFQKYNIFTWLSEERDGPIYQDFLRQTVEKLSSNLPKLNHYICAIAENILKVAPVRFKCPDDVLLKVCSIKGANTDSCLNDLIFAFLKSYTERDGHIKIFEILKDNTHTESSSFDKFWLIDFLKTLIYEDGFPIIREFVIPLSDHINSKRNESIIEDYRQLCDVNYYKLFSLIPQLLKNNVKWSEFTTLSPILLDYVKSDVRKSPFILEGIKYFFLRQSRCDSLVKMMTPYTVEWFPVLFDKHIHHVTPDAMSGLAYQVLKELFRLSQQYVVDDFYQQFESRLSSCSESSLKYHIDIIILLLRHISYEPLLKAFTCALNNLNPQDEKHFKLQLKYILNIHKNLNDEFSTYFLDNLPTISSQYSIILSTNVPSCTHIFIEILKEALRCFNVNSNSVYFYQFIGYIIQCLQNPSIKNTKKAIKFIAKCHQEINNLQITYNKFVTKLIHEHSVKFPTGCLEFIFIFWKSKPNDELTEKYMSGQNIKLLLKLFQNSTKRQFSTLLQILELEQKSVDFKDHYLNIIKAIFKRTVLIKVKSNQCKVQKYIKKAIKLLGYDKVKAVIPIENQRMFRSLYKKSTKRARKSENTVKSENYDETNPEFELQESEDVVDISNINSLKRQKIAKIKTESEFLTDKDGKIIIESEGSSYEEEEIDEHHPDYISSNGSNASDDGGDEVDDVRSSKNINKTLININSKPKSEKVVRFGDEYKSVKGGGDMKLKGKPDPYSYVPLNARRSGKKNINQLSGQFKGIIKAKKNLKRFSKS